MTYCKRKLRIHITNGKEHTWTKVHQVCYCGESYDNFSGPFNHVVYSLHALTSGRFSVDDKDLCPDCMASPDLAIEILRGLDD